jgi:hypothetical protein
MACLDSVIIIKAHLLHHSLPPSRERGVYGFQIGVGEEIERRGEERTVCTYRGPFARRLAADISSTRVLLWRHTFYPSESVCSLLLSWSSLLRPVPRRGERARRRQSSGSAPGLYASLPSICREHLPRYTKFSLLRGCRFRDMMPRHMFLTGGGCSSSILLHGAKSRRVGSRSHGAAARFTRCCARANPWRPSDLRLKISPSEVRYPQLPRFLIC